MRFANLIEYLHALPAARLSPAVIDSARIALLDNLGCGLFGAKREWGRIITDLVCEERSQGHATIYGRVETAAPARAALANGTCTHGFELDDIILGALSHPGAVVVPAALAAAESARAKGSELLRAIVAGYEVMARVGAALGHDHNNRGFHTTGIAGPVASTVAAGMVMGLCVDTLLSAVGTACSSAAGIKAFTQDTMTAQYSVPFCAGVALADDPRSPEPFMPDRLWDETVRGIAARTRLSVDPGMDEQYPAHFGAHVAVELESGAKHEQSVLDPHGTPADPFTAAEAQAKFRVLAGAAKSPAAIEHIVSAVARLSDARSLEKLSSALRS